MLARLVYHYRGARRLRRASIDCAHSEIISKLDMVSAELNVGPPALLVSTKITKPLLTGIFKPAIILPPSVFCLTRENIELILKHELAHLKRRDLAWNYIAASAQTLLWFNPLTWFCERESRFTQEIACDELALGGQTNRTPEFANLLVAFAAQRERGPQVLTVSIIRTANTLERRLKAMKTIHRKGSRQLIATCVVALALTPTLLPWRAIAQKPDAADARGNPPVAAEAGAPAKISPTEEELLNEEIQLAHKELDAISRASQDGRASREEVIAKTREVEKLNRELASLNGDTSKIRSSLEAEIKDVEELQSAARKRLEIGAASPEEKFKIDREILHLKRQLAALDHQPPNTGVQPNSFSGLSEATNSVNSMSFYMQNPELMKRYFPQLYAMMKTNGGRLPGPGGVRQPEPPSAPQTFQDRLRRAYAERSPIRLQPKRHAVVMSVRVKPGDHVKEGQNLVHLDDREARIGLRAAESEYAIAEADYALKKKELENKLLWSQNSVKNASDEFKKSLQEEHDLKLKRLDSELRLASIKIEQARLQLDDLTIKAPSDGLIGTVPLVGQTLSETSVAVEILPDSQK
jgi:hypothetical protein